MLSLQWEIIDVKVNLRYYKLMTTNWALSSPYTIAKKSNKIHVNKIPTLCQLSKI